MQQFLKSNHGTLCFIDEGSSENPTVIFIHGFPLTKESWDYQAAVLVPYFRVIRYDLMGLGKSVPENVKISIDTHVQDLISILNYCQVDKATLVGLSMGGYVALKAAKLFPKRFNSLILANTRAAADSDEAKQKRAKQIEEIRKGNIHEFASTTAGALVNETFKNNHHEKFVLLIDIIKSQSPEGLCENLTAMAEREDAKDSLKSINVPVLVITSDDDKVIPAEEGIAIQQKLPFAKHEQIKDAGHLSNLTQPEVFTHIIKNFIMTLYTT